MDDYLSIVNESLVAMYKVRTDRGGWLDDDNDQGLVKTLEGIAGFGTVVGSLKDLREHVDPSYLFPSTLEDTWREDIDAILQVVDKLGYTPEPYLDEQLRTNGVDISRGVTDFTDTASYVLTGLVDVIRMYQTCLKKPVPRRADIDQQLRAAFDWLLDNAITKGNTCYWTWGGRKYALDVPSVYFTWSATVALSYVLQSSTEFPLKKKDVDRCRAALAGVANWLSGIVNPDLSVESGRKWQIVYPGIFDAEDKNRTNTLFIYAGSICHWLSQVDIEVPDQTATKIVRTLLYLYAEQEVDQLLVFESQGASHVVKFAKGVLTKQSDRVFYEDRSYEYLLLAVLSWYYSLTRGAGSKVNLGDGDLSDLEDFLDRTRARVIGDRSSSRKLWKGPKYQVYLTQRAIDAIVTYLCYVYPLKSGPMGSDTEKRIERAVGDAFCEMTEEMQTKLVELALTKYRSQVVVDGDAGEE
ncbi:hypothetical protein JXD38_05810 [candidate division WOR-3 bacterium]|nr:hypothetical protein [candidate division WOR-3 bacterium]